MSPIDKITLFLVAGTMGGIFVALAVNAFVGLACVLLNWGLTARAINKIL